MILHYALGFPSYRTGGLTKFCIDLMQTQKEKGNEVALLWPGRIYLTGKRKISIRKGWYNCGNTRIGSYEIVNPLPVPLDEGISQIEEFMAAGDIHVYVEFLKQLKPNVIHIHTLMGLHREFIQAAQKLEIRTVFTTHDYFGLCPKVTLFCEGKVCNDMESIKCACCNGTALSLKKIQLMQSVVYRKLKDTMLVKKLRIAHRKRFFENNNLFDNKRVKAENKELAKQYQKLRQFYVKMLSEIDMIHFNSTVSEKVYKRYFIPKESRIIPISHKTISDNRKEKNFSGSKLRITYLASAKPFKGFYFLIQALDELWMEGYRNFELNSYSISGEEKPYLFEQNGFTHEDLKAIFDETDVLIAPSIWYETYGFTVLEALSYGVPVIVSGNVGAKDIIPAGGGIILKEITVEELKMSIKSLDMACLKTMNRIILTKMKLPNLLDVEQNIYQECYCEQKRGID